MSKVTQDPEDFDNLKEWAHRRQNELLMFETLRKQAGVVYPTDIELQFRNLKEACHKLDLMCDEHLYKVNRGMRKISASPGLGREYGVESELGSAPSEEEIAIFNHQEQLRQHQDAWPNSASNFIPGGIAE